MSISTAVLDTSTLAERISRNLQRSPFSPKKLAHRIKSDPRAFRAYWAGECTPPANKLLMLMAESQALQDEINQIIEEIRQHAGLSD
jgi:ribosome-binding protein aMBF1 (putative translation factor)